MLDLFGIKRIFAGTTNQSEIMSADTVHSNEVGMKRNIGQSHTIIGRKRVGSNNVRRHEPQSGAMVGRKRILDGVTK